MAHHYERLRDALADEYTVSIIDRRGRGASGPQGPGYSLEREVDDLEAVAAAESARLVFGHSYGGLIALQAARTSLLFEKAAVYEPTVSLNGSFDLSFAPEFERLLADGHHTRAMALFLRSTRLTPLGNAPRPVYLALSALLLGGRDGLQTRELMSTTPREMREVARTDSDGSGYRSIEAATLLLRGTKSPPYLTGVLDTLGEVIPHARVESVVAADHNAPDESDPLGVAARLLDFFTPSVPTA